MGLRLARIKMAPELLIEALRMPCGTRIVNAAWCDRGSHPSVVLTVENQSLREVSALDEVPELTPILHWDWGQDRIDAFEGKP